MERDNPFRAGGDLRRRADLMLARSRITRSELCIVDPDLVLEQPPPAASQTRLQRAADCRRPRPRVDRPRPASDCLPSDRPLPGDVPGCTAGAANGQAVTECGRVERLDGDGMPSIGRAVTVTVSPGRRTERTCCTVS